jgi:hypothetical protein
MKSKFLLILLLLFTSLTGAEAFSQESLAFDFSFGLGYDNVSERYYLIHYDTLAVPSESLETLRRATEEIEEQKAVLRLGLKKGFAEKSLLSLNNSFSLGNLYMRDILRIAWEKDGFSLSNQAELKTIQDKEKLTYQTDYFTNNLDVRLKVALSPGLTLGFKNNLEYTEYKEYTIYAYDYYRNRTSVELDKDLSSGGFLHLSYQFSQRNVPDSVLLHYDRHFFYFSFDKYFGWETLFLLENELERKLFNKPEGMDSYWEDRFTFRLSRRVHDKVELLFGNELDVLSYDVEDEVSFDYFEDKFSAFLEYELLDGLEIAGGPELIFFSSLRRDLQDYDYTQSAFILSLDVMRSAQFWLSLEDRIGKRDYESDKNPFYTDYLLNQLTLFLDGELASHLGFNLMLSVDSEWHDSKGDNLTVFLISSELAYSF